MFPPLPPGSRKCLIFLWAEIENEWGVGRRVLVSGDQKGNNAIFDWSLNASWDFQWMANNEKKKKPKNYDSTEANVNCKILLEPTGLLLFNFTSCRSAGSSTAPQKITSSKNLKKGENIQFAGFQLTFNTVKREANSSLLL